MEPEEIAADVTDPLSGSSPRSCWSSAWRWLLNRNPVASALCLVVSFLGLAALFVGLDAYFIGVIQVLVYAGAVMVLFLFIIMLLDLKAEERRKSTCLGRMPAAVLGARSPSSRELWLVCKALSTAGHQAVARLLAAPGRQASTMCTIGIDTFQQHNLPFQVVGVLILVATIGVVVLPSAEVTMSSPSTIISSSAACSSPSASPG